MLSFMTSRLRIPVIAVAFGLAAIVLSGCYTRVDRHGHQLTQADIEQVQKGMTQLQVRQVLGTPSTTATITGDVYYYISSRMETVVFLKPTETERRIFAVYFSGDKTVSRLANYGLKDGRIFDFISRETPTQGKEMTVLGQMFGNLGRVNPF